MNWWCSASGAAWEWSWRPYPGVWLLVALLSVPYLRARGRARRAGKPWSARETLCYLLGVLVFWVAADWPVGALGAGYLVSVHTVQYLLFGLIAPPLLLLGVPAWAWEHPTAGSRLGRFLRFVARPAVGLLVFNAILLVTHVPGVVDTLMPTQFGSFVVDISWVLGGLALWCPVVAPAPVGRLSPLARIGYLFVSTIVPTAPAAFLVFADYPIYALYELAPRVHDISAKQDQQLAGLIMKVIGDPIMWFAMSVVFFRWAAAEGRAEAVERAAVPPGTTR